MSHRAKQHLKREAGALAGSEGTALPEWLHAGHAVSQKRRDAEALLRHLAAGVEPTSPPDLEFQHAQVWEHFREMADAADSALAPRVATEL